MKHTKNILKSLLITVMALSLLAVSCKKDEGGSKPTDPTPKNSATLLTEMLKRLGELKEKPEDGGAVILNLSNITPKKGEAAIEGANNTKNSATGKYKVVEVLQNTFTKASFQSEQIGLNADLTVANTPSTGNKNPLSVDITFIANKGYTFDDSITEGNAYTYDENAGTAKLTLKITPAQAWE